MKTWLKYLCVALLIYTVIAGFLLPVPALPVLHETIRNLHFHVTMWFAMIILFAACIINGIKYLNKGDIKNDIKAFNLAKTGMILGILGLITGSIWAKFTWGAWWVNDAKLNGSAASMLVYAAYFMLRSGIEDHEKRARLSAVYSIFSFVIIMVLIIVMPRLTDSLHPGNGGNPGFSSYDLDNRLRAVFYPAILGWTLLGFWISSLFSRIAILEIQED